MVQENVTMITEADFIVHRIWTWQKNGQYQKYDVIIGYRADDSYFSFAQDFLNNAISLRKLSRAMNLGKLGLQTVLKSERAFAQITFQQAFLAENKKWMPQKMARQQSTTGILFQQEGTKKTGRYLYVANIGRGDEGG